ncbi:hypothetical protein G6N05_13890 [Flavobacterium sp. F372]|uniref:Sensor histidine kinase n=2 Tax=Flavobacterium bernardetii TaxID=2813823 RepID=A0ABR7J2V3_9FLAO|nr:hypothetical protein [Flavobacterium bernardetii]MBC5836057.1 hypothetical protein [Flavobacterium bernardetii]NHF71203.1 hypothetical protein [Flavobacterium bernardetii]
MLKNKSLKFLISLKLFLYLFFIGTLVFISVKMKTDYENLENVNELLEEKISYYQAFVVNNDTGSFYDQLSKSIKHKDLEIKALKQNNTFSLSSWFCVILMFCSIYFYIASELESKIKKLKSEESDFEEQQML